MRTMRRRLILLCATAAWLLVGCGEGTKPSPSAIASGAASEVASPTGSGGGNEPGPATPLFAHVMQGSAGMTVAVDSTGVIHVAGALAEGNPNLLYGRCAGRCDQASSWEIVPLPSVADVNHVPTIALTDDDRPRILFASDLPGSAGYYYLECDSECGRVASWHSVRLTEESPESNGVANPRMPFAVSGEGAAAFAYDDGFGMYVWVCNSRCAAVKRARSTR